MTGPRQVRFTMLDEKGPAVYPPGSDEWPIVDLVHDIRFVMLDPKPPMPNPAESDPLVADGRPTTSP
jgi:hypothetical protein